MAKLYFRYGVMNCGKSTALIQVAHNYYERGMQPIIIKPFTDTKGGDQVVSRLGVTRKVDILLKEHESVKEAIETWKEKNHIATIHCILGDEAQFFTALQIDQFFRYAVFEDVPVICYGIRTDFLGKGFPGSTRLLEMAHSIEELKTICRCGKKAMFNSRRVNGIPVFEGSQVSIEGENEVLYESVCAKCYYDLMKKYNPNLLTEHVE